MALDPAIVKKLSEDVPEFNQFRIYLAEQLMKLDSLDALKDVPRGERDVVLEGCIKARVILSEILGGLLDSQVLKSAPMAADYAVDVDIPKP